MKVNYRDGFFFRENFFVWMVFFLVFGFLLILISLFFMVWKYRDVVFIIKIDFLYSRFGYYDINILMYRKVVCVVCLMFYRKIIIEGLW